MRFLAAGITTVRDVGSPDDEAITLREAIRLGLVDGPRIVSCGRIVSATAPGGRIFGTMYEEADGPWEMRRGGPPPAPPRGGLHQGDGDRRPLRDGRGSRARPDDRRGDRGGRRRGASDGRSGGGARRRPRWRTTGDRGRGRHDRARPEPPPRAQAPRPDGRARHRPRPDPFHVPRPGRALPRRLRSVARGPGGTPAGRSRRRRSGRPATRASSSPRATTAARPAPTPTSSSGWSRPA